MKRYVKFSGDNCKLGNFTRNKAYEVIEGSEGSVSVKVKSDGGRVFTVMTGLKCGFLNDMESWKFCDEHGNELDSEKKQGYKGQFDLADGDVWTRAVRGTEINITQILRMIADRAG